MSPSRLPSLYQHAFSVAALVAFAALHAVSHGFNADNTWHFRLARDIWVSMPVYWSGVDANRMFPDLLIGLAAFALPFGDIYLCWLIYDCALLMLLYYLGLTALAAALFADLRQRRTFLLVDVAILLVSLGVAPFWTIWLIDPGNHGGAVPVCLVVMALLVGSIIQERMSAARALVAVSLLMLIVASNRYLIISFVIPLVCALAILTLHSFAAPHGSSRGAARWKYAMLASAVAVGEVLAVAAWSALGQSTRFRMLGPGQIAKFPDGEYLAWLLSQVDKERAVFVNVPVFERWQIVLGAATLGVVLCAWIAGLFRSGRAKLPNSNSVNPGLVSNTIAFSGLCSLSFVVVFVLDQGDWHYRYLTVSVALAATGCALLFTKFRGASMQRLQARGSIAMTALALAAAGVSAAHSSAPAVETRFAAAIAELTNRLRSHAPNNRPLRGFAYYWLGNDINARTDALRLSILDYGNPAAWFYNNNAGELCADGFFFVLVNESDQGMNISPLLATLGPPSSTEHIDLPPYPDDTSLEIFDPAAYLQRITILYFDPTTLRSALLDPARENARHIFSGFRCPP